MRSGQAAEFQEGLDEGFLRRVLGRISVVHVAQAEAVDRVPVAVDQGGEGFQIAAQTGLHQLSVRSHESLLSSAHTGKMRYSGER